MNAVTFTYSGGNPKPSGLPGVELGIHGIEAG
jgi:hypothetical protein